MIVKCKRRDLVYAISISERAVAVKSTLSILEGIYIEAKEGKLQFLSNNLELGIDISIDAEVQKAGAVVVKANLFSTAVKKLPDFEDDVLIEVSENEVITLSCGNAKFDFSTAKADEFPRLPVVEHDSSFVIKESVLKDMIRKTIYALAQTDIKPQLSGLYFDIENDEFHMVGCDGYRLAIRKEEIADRGVMKFIMPGKTAKELLSVLGDTDEEIEVLLTPKNAQINLKSCIMITRLIDGEYLDYRSVCRHKNTLTITTKTKKILDSIDRAALIVNETTKAHVVLKIEDDNVLINCETVVGKVKDKFSVDMEGEPIEIAFNPRYLMDAFKNCDCEEIKFSFSTPVNPTMIMPAEGDDFLFIVLPVRMR
ncbi:MAG: DNA polymerase III subunit beta [Clostridia bacterium]|nr:DNA polymerase III subunit beta [Clostridia bacterium]